MRKIIINVLFIAAIVIGLNYVLIKTVYPGLLPYYWGSYEISDKREILLQRKNITNALFIGSSKTHNQIDPVLFDQRAKEAGLDLQSYNFGVGGLTPLESLHIYENLLLQDSFKFKYAFIELDWLATILYENLNVPRSFYWLNSKNYATSATALLSSSVPVGRRAWGLFHYSLDYAENMLNVGKVQEYFKFKKHKVEQRITSNDSNVVYNGFIPIPHHINYTEKDLYDEVVSSARLSVQNFDALAKQEMAEPFLQRLKNIMAISAQRGINTYFVVPLQWKYYQYRELVPIINAIGTDKVICMFDIDKYQHVYQHDYFADPNHLNAKGAKVYTEQLFSNFKNQCGDIKLAKQ